MANIKFYRVVASYWNTVTPQEGFVWFNTDDRTISLYKNGVWEQYSGIKSATYVDNVLTVTPCVGDSVVVDFNALHADIYEELAKLEGITDKVTTYVVAAISAETSAREAADSAITNVLNGTKNEDGSEKTKGLVKEVEALRAEMNALGGIEGGDGIRGMIDAKIEALDLSNTYETKGAAAQALTDAKVYVDGIVNDTTTEVDGVVIPVKGLNSRVADLEAIDHDQLAADAASTAVATILDEAPEAFDTLKEVADWIANNEHATDVANLMTDVANLKAIDHEAYKAADTELETTLKTYADDIKAKIDATIEENELVVTSALTDLDGRLINLSTNTLSSVTGQDYVSVQVTGGVATVNAITGTVMNNADALAVASDVKSYVDSMMIWEEF